MSVSIRFLSQTVLEQLQLPSEMIVASIENLLKRRSRSQNWSAPKVVITPPDGRYMMATLAAEDEPQILAVKTLLLNPKNVQRGLKSIYALVTLLDSDTGEPLAVLNGEWVTAVRTAGLSAVAARYLARDDASVAAFIGCGVQAHSHLQAFTDLFPLKKVYVFGRGTKSRDIFCQSVEKMGLTAIASLTPQDAIQDADLVVTSVSISPELKPFLDARWLKPGAFVTMTDLAASWFADGMQVFNCIIIDDLEQEAQMQKPLVQPSLITGDIIGLVGGKIAGRRHPDERAAFVFRGLGLGDLAVSALAYQQACETSQGQLVEI